MSPASTKPVIFISYAHADEPDKPAEGEVQWLSFVRVPCAGGEDGVFELWVDREMSGGADWDPRDRAETSRLRHLRFARLPLLDGVRLHRRQRDRDHSRAAGEGRRRPFYPLLLTPTPKRDWTRSRTRTFGRATPGRSPVSAIMIAFSTCRTRPTRSRGSRVEIVARKGASAPPARPAPPSLRPHRRPPGNRLRTPRRPRGGAEAPRRRLGRFQDQHSFARRRRRRGQVGAGQRMAEAIAGRQLSRRKRGARLVVLQPGHEGARDLGGRVPRLGGGQARRQACVQQRRRQGRGDRRGDDAAARAARARRRRAVAARSRRAARPVEGPGPARAAAPLRGDAAGRGARLDRAHQPAGGHGHRPLAG